MFFDLKDVTCENMLLNFCVSARGAGKTFSTLKDVITDFEEKGEQFIYVRRTQSELDLCLPSLFSSLIKEGFFSDHVLQVKGETFLFDGKVMGRGVAISTAYKFKSVGFPDVKTIVFDEFISESKSYLKDEVTKFLSIIETVGRMRENLQIVALANQDTIFNPYYAYFGIRPASPETKKTRFRTKSVMIYQFNSQEYKDAKKATRFGKLISGTPYGGFMLDNDAFKDDYSFVDDLKGIKKDAFVNLTISGTDITGYNYVDNNRNYIFLAPRSPVDGVPSYNLDKQLREDKTIDNIRRNPYLRRIKMYFERGFITFKDIPTKQLISEVIF